MTAEKLIEDLRTEWQKLGFHPNVTITFTPHVNAVTASVPSSSLPTIKVPVPRQHEDDDYSDD
jgi:hypothetical protein